MITTDTLNLMAEKQTEAFTHVVFSGGGAKGSIYPGAYEVIKNAGIVNNIKGVAGSSAGAITAAFVATGMSPEEFARVSSNTNLTALLGKGTISKDGKPLYDLLDKTIRKNIADYFGQISDIPKMLEQRLAEIDDKQIILERNLAELRSDINQLPDRDLANEIKILESELSENKKLFLLVESLSADNNRALKKIKERCVTGDKITFKDLADLRVCNSELFKDLLITAVNKTTGQLEIFSANTTPDVEIALACRASASIPIFFEAVKIGESTYVDGGYIDNIPLSYFDQNNEDTALRKSSNPEAIDISNNPEEFSRAKNSGRPLVFAFGNDMNSAANIAIYSAKERIFDPGAITKFIMDVVFKNLARVGGNFKYSDNENKTHNNLRDNALNVIVLNTGNIGTLSFDSAEKKAEYMYIKGYCQTEQFLDNQKFDVEQDSRVQIRSFMLDIYENTSVKRENSWLSMVQTRAEGVKSKELLPFLKMVNGKIT